MTLYALKLPAFTQKYLKYYLLGAAYLFVGFCFLSDYLTLNATTILGLAMAPYLVIPANSQAAAIRYLWPALLFLGLSWVVPGKSGIYFSLVLALLFALEGFMGRLNNLLIFLVFILSPLFQFALVSFGFPIRLWLSAVSANFLSTAGFKAVALGNTLVLDGIEFSVDPACMGLNMLHISLLLGLFMLAYLERLTQKRLSFWQVFVALGFLMGLNIFSNLLRILVLAIFKIMPGYTMHEIAGLLCFVLYVIAPFYLIARKIFCYLPSVPAFKKTGLSSSPKTFVLSSLLLAGITARAVCLPDARHTAALADISCSLPGYTKTKLAAGVIQFRKTDALVYVKPVDRFYRAEHTPLICWTGSGYTLEKIKEQTCSGYTVYTGILRKNQDMLYTAWWYDNGRYKTNEQLTWRWQMLTGTPNYSLINVSTETEADLLRETSILLKRNIFN